MKDIKNMIWNTASNLWEEPTTLEAIATHLCYLVTSAYAFYFFVLFAADYSANYFIIREANLNLISTLLQWSNFFINLLTILIIFEVSSYIAIAYWDYRRDNL